MIDWRDPDGRPRRNPSALAMLRWGVATVAIVALHAGGLWAVLNWKPATASEGESPEAVMIELAPLAVAAEAPPQQIAPGPQMSEAQPGPTPDVPEERVETPKQDPQPTPAQEPDPPQPDPEIKIPELSTVPNAAAVLPPPPPPRVERRPARPVQRAERRPVKPEPPRTRQATAPPSSRAKSSNVASAPSSGSQASSASQASWRGSLMAHLNRHKRFPPGAAGAGVATVAFTISRSGAVLSARLVRSSGDRALDAEAVSLPRRASPVPAPPSDVGGGSITVAVPIRFER